MALLSKESLLKANDLKEKEVELPTIGGSVKVRGLSAAYSNEASSKALKLISGPRGEQQATVDTAELEIIQVLHGLVEPQLTSIEEARLFAQNCGPAFKDVVKAIDDLSGLDKEAIEKAAATFPASNGSEAEQAVEDPTDAGGR